MMTVYETQNTTTNGETISGEIIIRFTNIKLDDLLKYRASIRNMTGFGTIGISQTVINEKALIAENNLDRRPETFKEAQPAPIPQEFGGDMALPVRRLPGQRKKEKKPYIHSKMRGILTPLVGADQQTIIQTVNSKVKKTRYTDAQIMEMYNTIHGIR
jgi:hypothetical protein